jgi:hypothetical protein
MGGPRGFSPSQAGHDRARILTAGDDPELRERYGGELHQAPISNCGSHELQTHAVVFDKYFRYALQYRGSATVEQHRALHALEVEGNGHKNGNYN